MDINLIYFILSCIGVVAVISLYMFFAKIADDYSAWRRAKIRKRRQINRYAKRANMRGVNRKRWKAKYHDGQKIYYDDIH